MKKNTVILSVNNDEGHLCVDIFIRENKTFGLKNIEKILKILMGGTKLEITVIKYIRTKEAYKNACKNILWLKYKK